MKLYSLTRTQQLNISLEEAWEFFSNPSNLKEITPSWLGFEITSNIPQKIYSGLLISYQVTPVLGITTPWVTEILQIKEPYFFVDEQKIGPYHFWRHQHIFKEMPNGVQIKDVVNYALPMSFLGELMHALVVEKQLKEIFDFRYKVLEQKFC